MPASKDRAEQPDHETQPDGPNQSGRDQGEGALSASLPGEVRELDDSAILRSAFQAIIENPNQAKELTNCFVRLMAARDPDALATYVDAERRRFGMWIGAALAVLCIGGGLVVLGLGFPLPIGVGLLSAGAACAGGTFAVITGQKVGLPEFKELIHEGRRDEDRASLETAED